jgi:pimeloyl-ACP methyl ester carboxylesterase
VPGTSFEVGVEGGRLHGRVAGSGEAVLLLHGGPAVNWTYLQPLLDELADGYRVAVYQQRGMPPSTAGPPYDVSTQVADVVAVLDVLGWDRAVVVGHSWGGHLLLHVLVERRERVTAAMLVDTLGGVGDGGEAEFDVELTRRTPPRDVERLKELERHATSGEGGETDPNESMRLLWPAYFADPASAPPFPGLHFAMEAYSATFESLRAELPGLARRLAGLAVPTLFVHGAGSPMPLTASSATAHAIGPGASVQVLDGAGHFPWLERPGALRTALDGLAGG